jgi:chitinase
LDEFVGNIKAADSSPAHKRLNGLFIWAIDQDTTDNKLLDAVLYPDGLGKFKEQNGAGNDGSQWESQPLTYCQWSGETILYLDS